jgi:hypothetical protein
MNTGLLELAPSVNTPERVTGEALLHGSPKRKPADYGETDKAGETRFLGLPAQ